MADVISLAHYATDIEQFMAAVDIRKEFFAEPFPITTTVEVSRLYRPDLRSRSRLWLKSPLSSSGVHSGKSGRPFQQRVPLAAHRQLDDAVLVEGVLGELRLLIAHRFVIHANGAALDLAPRVTIG